MFMFLPRPSPQPRCRSLARRSETVLLSTVTAAVTHSLRWGLYIWFGITVLTALFGRDAEEVSA